MPPSKDRTELENALTIAFEAHSGQTTFAGRPYIFHPIRVMEQMETDEERCVALLHDVVEDTDVPLEMLAKWFSKDVVDAVKALTHIEGVPYETYIENFVTRNRLAAKVKLADLRDNIRIERLPKISDGALRRTKKYHKAIQRLKRQCYFPGGRLA
jgi:(p)ppGpp synthase/HD superfamily hydrolase